MIYLFLVAINIFFNRVRGRWTIFSLLLVGELIFLSGNPDPLTTADYMAYQGEYQNKLLGYNSRFEWLYQKITDVSIHYNLEYSQVRLILVSLFFLVMFIGVYRLTRNFSYYWILFSLGLFFIETIQIRSFGMISFVILGISFLKNRKLWNYLLATFFIFLGTGLHSSGYLFLIVPIIHFFINPWRTSILKNALLFNLVVCGILIFSSTSGASQVLAGLLNKVSNNSETAGNIALLYATGFSQSTILLLAAFIIPLIYLIMILKQHNFLLNQKSVPAVLSLIVVTMIGIPLLILSNQYDRVLREGMMGMLILMAIIKDSNGNSITINKNYYFEVLYFIFIFVFLGGVKNSFVFQNIFHYIHLT